MDFDSLPTFDIEYIFLNIRAKSIGEDIKMTVTCPDDGVTQVPSLVDIDEIKLDVDLDHEKDIVLDDKSKLLTKKVLTSTSQPEVAVIEGVEELLQENKIKSSDIKMIIHGTTLATNAVIEERVPKLVL